MSMIVRDIIHWLKSLDKDVQVGVDEGGLCLRVHTDIRLTGDYCEIGGIPGEIEYETDHEVQGR